MPAACAVDGRHVPASRLTWCPVPGLWSARAVHCGIACTQYCSTYGITAGKRPVQRIDQVTHSLWTVMWSKSPRRNYARRTVSQVVAMRAMARACVGMLNQSVPAGKRLAVDRRLRRICVTPADTANSAAPDGPATQTGHG